MVENYNSSLDYAICIGQISTHVSDDPSGR